MYHTEKFFAYAIFFLKGDREHIRTIRLVSSIPQRKPVVGDKVYAMIWGALDVWLKGDIIGLKKIRDFEVGCSVFILNGR